MKTKIKRHSRSVLSVVLALCMLLSCMTAGMIMTDAAKVDSESVSWNPTTDKFSYQVNNGGWTDLSFNSNGVTTFTVSNDNSALKFKLVFNGTVYNHNSSQSTFSADGMHSKDGETRLAKTGGSDYSVSGIYADTYTVKLTTTVNNGEVNFKINGTYVKPASSWTVVGDSEELFGGTWNTTNTANDLDMTQTPYTWTKNAVYLSAGDIEYKVVKDYAWAGCYPAAGNRKTTVSSSGYYNVTVTYDGKTDLKMTLAPAAKRTLTVPQIADATVTATYGSQTAAEGQSLTEVPAGADITVNVTPDSGHKCTGVSGETLSAGSSTATGSGTNWTLKMPNSDATLAATIEAYQAQMRRIYFYNKYTQYPMVSIYAYYKTGDTITDEIFGSGTTMTKLPNSDIWTIDVPENAYVRFMGEGKNTGELQPVADHPAAPKYVPGPDRDNPGTGGYWGEYIERNNVYSVNEGENMSSSNLFTGITATFFDYYVDNEVTGGWLTGIMAESDYKCSGYTNDPYRTYLNAALSNYADNNITYPLYWGNNKNINGDNTDATANVHSGDLYNFYLSVNNSAKLNPPSTAMQGLAGNSLAGGNIHHYKADVTDNNGAAMAFFDEDFLSGENSKNKALATILHSPKFPVRKDAASKTLYLDTSANTGWENDNAVMRAVFFNSATNEAGRHIVQAAKVADHLYAVAVPSNYAKVQWWRGDPNDVGTPWNYGNDVSIPTDNNIACKIKDGAFNNNDEWVASSSTTTTHTYYEYDSTNGKDNAYITDINTTDKTANLSYYDQASGKYVQSQNNIKGFFPFDYNNVISAPYDVKKVYLNLNNIWNTENNAVFYAYFMGGSGFPKWVPMTLDNTVNYYSCEIPSGATGVIFVRQNSQGANFPSWDSKYNQTNDLSIPTDQKVIYKITGWGTDKSTGEWTSSNNVVVEKKVTSTNNFADPTERLAHDQGFGMKLEIPFTLNKYGVNKDGSPQTFDFSGDDDLWVYIDDKLVLDLGGAHGRTTGTINFNSMQAVADTAAAVTTGTDQVDGGIRSYDFSSIINTAANDFNHNQIHTMTIYYMERGMFDSNLRFGFSFSAVDTLFSAEKKIRTRSLNSGFFVDNGLTGAESNMSDLKLDKGVRQVTEFEKSFQSDQFDITQTYVGPLPEGRTDITYSIGADSTTISNATNPIGYTLQNTDQTEKRAYFNGQFTSGDTFTMKETAKDGNKYNYTPSIIVYDEAKKLSNGNPTPFETVANATSRGQVSGNNTDGYKFLFQPINAPAAGGLEDLRIRARFENDMKQHALTIKKTVSDPADTTTAFNFKIQFDFTDDKVDNYVGYPLVINGHSDTTLSPEGRVTIKAGQSITLYGIPENAKIKVVEITSPEGYVYDSTTVKTDGGLTVDTEDETQGVSFEMGTANTVVTFKNSKGEPVHITHTLHPDSTGQADCYVSATVQNASGDVQTGGNFEQTDAMITVPAEFINYTSTNKLVIVLNTVPADHSNFTNFYEKITDEMKTLAASGIPYSAEIDLPNRTATITIEIKDLFDATTHKQLYKTLPFYSELQSYCYTVVFTYTSRLWGDQTYTTKGFFTAEELKKYVDHINETEGIVLKTAETNSPRDEFIQKKAPYEDNFKQTVSWILKDKTNENPKGVEITQNITGHEIVLNITGMNTSNTTIPFKMNLPFAYTATDKGMVYTSVNEDGSVNYDANQRLFEDNTGFEQLYSLNNDRTPSNACFVQAPESVNNNGVVKHFSYWNVYDYENTTLIRRCYSRKFNLAFYEPYYIVPIYNEFDHISSQASQAQEWGSKKEATIHFLENSRNQWNLGGGNKVRDVDSYWEAYGDRLFSDFVVEYRYNNKLISSYTAEDNVKTGIVIERVKELNNTADGGKDTKLSHYSAVTEDPDQGVDTVKTYVNNNFQKIDDKALLNSAIDYSDLDNKNMREVYYGFANIYQADQGTNAGNPTTLKNYLYRAYAYIKVDTDDAVVSKPAYFTIYDMASIECYYDNPDAKGGMS